MFSKRDRCHKIWLWGKRSTNTGWIFICRILFVQKKRLDDTTSWITGGVMTFKHLVDRDFFWIRFNVLLIKIFQRKKGHCESVGTFAASSQLLKVQKWNKIVEMYASWELELYKSRSLNNCEYKSLSLGYWDVEKHLHVSTNASSSTWFACLNQEWLFTSFQRVSLFSFFQFQSLKKKGAVCKIWGNLLAEYNPCVSIFSVSADNERWYIFVTLERALKYLQSTILNRHVSRVATVVCPSR